MGGIAAIAKQAGFRVTGCDASVYPPMSDQLARLGIELIEGFGADQMALKPDVWVVGNVVTRGKPLMEAILDAGARYVSGPQWLAENILRDRWVLAVAGTHGKTTTSSMLAWILEASDRQPGFLIGGVAHDFGVSARTGRGPHFVIEADEYDTAFFDKRSKFVHYRPRTAILNNLEFDHADIFDDLAAIERQFHHFVRTVPASGRLVVNGRDRNLDRVLDMGCWTPVERFGTPQGWEAGKVADDGSFEVAWQGAPLGRIRGSLTGEFNRMNALAALAAARHAGIEPAQGMETLGRFQGVRRRLELRGTVRGIRVYDDFAHHPTAIRETLAGLRQRAPGARILAVFEPRSNTLKKGVLKDALPGSFDDAAQVHLFTGGLTWDAEGVFSVLGGRVRCSPDLDALVAGIVREARPGDHVLVMSNGGFGGIHGKLLAALGASGAS